mmetsp:Transcript_10627/g.28386  ORF Transcript_10627/g.28386 Transcript_10627/m.28386 type:complete len:217 (+) Transcript_10627:811-1461(+)
MYRAARDLASNTASNFSQVWLKSMESCRMPAEWMKPTRFGVSALMYSSTDSALPQSHLACSTVIPNSAASLSISFQLGMFPSLTFIERERNLMENFLPPCALALLKSHPPITSPSAPLPPEMAMTPLSGSCISGSSSYGLECTFRCTYLPLFRMRTLLCPKDWTRNISATRYLVFSLRRDHSVSMYWIGIIGNSTRPVLHMPKRVQFVRRPAPHSS